MRRAKIVNSLYGLAWRRECSTQTCAIPSQAGKPIAHQASAMSDFPPATPNRVDTKGKFTV
jgi:hypothetical protein